MSEWYYIGHYGQLGPLTREQMDELIAGDVISRDTYVWKAGMSSWVYAGQVSELLIQFHAKAPAMDPPPPPAGPAYAPDPGAFAGNPTPGGPPSGGFGRPPMSGSHSRTYTSSAGSPYAQDPRMSPASYPAYPSTFVALRSNRSRIAGGVIQFLIPGVGRMYMGYWGLGILQFVTTALCGLGVVWSYIDGVVILVGGVKVDGYGRVMDI